MTIFEDFRVAFRSLRRRPTLVLALVLTLALGVGVNTTIYSLVDAVLLHPLPVPHADRLLAVRGAGGNGSTGAVSYAVYERLEPSASILDGVAAVVTTRLRSEVAGEQSYPAVAFVTDGYFEVLEVGAALGRTMLPGDPSVAGENPVVVLSWEHWQQHFGGDPGVLGRSIRVNEWPLTVVGVAPRKFRGTSLGFAPDMWVPLSMISALQVPNLSGPGGVDRKWPIFQVFGRLAPGVEPELAANGILAILSRFAAGEAKQPGTDRARASALVVMPLTQAAAAADNRAAMWSQARLLFGIGTLTLILACLNIANLLVLRADERRVELGVRAALGAGTRRLGQQIFAESTLLAILGGGVGLAVALIGIRLLSALTLPGGIALRNADLGIDGRALVFALVLSLSTAIVFGLAPAIGARRISLRNVLYGGATHTHRWRRRGIVLAFQVALSLIFLVCTSMLVQSLSAGLSTSLGFEPAPLAAVSVKRPNEGSHSESVAMYEAVVAQLEQAPGVLSAAAATHIPIAPAAARWVAAGPAAYDLYVADPALRDDGRPREQGVQIGLAHVTGDYFDALGVPLLDGRAFAREDGPDSERVLILNEAAARALFPGRSPVGSQVHAQLWSFAPFWFTYRVVGVVRNTRYRTIEDQDVPFAFALMAQDEFTESPVTFIARTTRGRDAVRLLERTVASIAPALVPSNAAEFEPRLVSDQVEAALAPQRLAIALSGGFALLALCVVAVGIYGTIAYSVARRTAEIGIRVALGARRRDILRLVLSATGASVAAGAAVGLVAAALAGPLLRPLLYQTGRADLLSFAAAFLTLVLVAACAAMSPSRRALRTDPVEAIRSTT